MTSSSPAVACLDHAPHKGVEEVAVRARRSFKSFWLGMVLQVTNHEFDSHVKYHTSFSFCRWCHCTYEIGVSRDFADIR